jgi:serine phosphatase RsbU (regulator of sigma subunit)
MEESSTRQHKILVVDDEPDMGPLISGMFRLKVKRGELSFVYAENGQEALDKLDEHDDIDLIFTDINMPVMDGLSFLSKVKEKGLLQKSIVISAYNDLKNIRTAMNRGAFDFVTKPIDPNDIKTTLTKGIEEMNSIYEGIKIKSELEEATKEKEKLIVKQNEMLEIQVKERTATIIEQKTLLEVKNKEIIDSINYAKKLQESILPPQSLFHSLISEGLIFYQSKDIVSGDFYWFGEKDDKKIIVCADCTGHGVAGALMSMMGMSLLNQIVNEKGIVSPSHILNLLDEALAASMKKSGGNTHIGIDAAILVFDKSGTAAQYAGANRPLWLIRNSEFIITDPDKSPIGGLHERDQENFTNHEISIRKNDTLYIFTDGFADQFGGDHGKKLMRKRFRETLLLNQQLSMEQQGIKLTDYFESWKGEHEQVDDVLVMGIKI